MNNHHLQETITRFIRQHVGSKPAVIGLSGGLDSSLTAFLAHKALGSKRLFALILPSSSNTEQDARLAKEVAAKLGIAYQEIVIDPIVTAYTQAADFFDDRVILGNLKARVRMALLYAKANAIGGLVLGTGNRTEIMVGYTTKYGDAACDLLPIGDVYKTETRALAASMDVPVEIIDRAPTAGLWEGQTDEGELGMPYEQLDAILMALEGKHDLTGFSSPDVAKVRTLVATAAHKRELPPICSCKHKQL